MFPCYLGIFPVRARLCPDEGVKPVPNIKEGWHTLLRELVILLCYLMHPVIFGKQEAWAYPGRRFERCQSVLINQREFPGSAAWVSALEWPVGGGEKCLGQGVLRGDTG
jgi:hypothetical protein